MQILIVAVFLTLGGVPQPGGCIYLTFDDGPGPGSGEVYSLAGSERVKVNLFIIGKQAVRKDSVSTLFQRHRKDSLLLIANHSYSHADGHYKAYYEAPAAVLEDFARNRDTLMLDHAIARLPGRNYWRLGERQANDIVNGKEAADSLAANGYAVFGWDLEWKCDSLHRLTGEEMLHEVDKAIRGRRTFTTGHIVILFHDDEFRDAAFLEQVRSFIKIARGEGRYTICHLTEYPVQDHHAHAGK